MSKFYAATVSGSHIIAARRSVRMEMESKGILATVLNCTNHYRENHSRLAFKQRCFQSCEYMTVSSKLAKLKLHIFATTETFCFSIGQQWLILFSDTLLNVTVKFCLYYKHGFERIYKKILQVENVIVFTIPVFLPAKNSSLTHHHLSPVSFSIQVHSSRKSSLHYCHSVTDYSNFCLTHRYNDKNN